jgi:NADPH-dependent 2,4-dienoyl-CoA reductase/sulfur reductase-like enzyme
VPLERALGPEIGAVCADLHRDHGVDVRLGVGISAIEGGERVEQVALADGSTIATDVVVVGVGVAPNTDWLSGSGLSLDDGVVCDATLLAAPGVVAAGDIARWPSRRFGEVLRVEHWENAIQQGEAAGRRLLADEATAEVYDPIPWFWSDQYDRKIQLAGVVSQRSRLVQGTFDEQRFVLVYLDDRDRLVGALCWNRPRQAIMARTLIADGGTGTEAAEKLG